MTTVRGKTAIVTGGANGIGFECCRQLLSNGAKAVAILDLANSNGEESAKKLTEEFGEKRAVFFRSDVTKFDEYEDVFKKATTALEGLDILINNAGICNERLWKKTIETNFMGVVNCSLIGYNYMGKHNGGKGGIIVNMCSIAGLVQYPSSPVYIGTKHAILGFTVSLKYSYETTGISVRIICPSVTSTSLVAKCNNTYLNFIDRNAAVASIMKLPMQSVDYVGNALIEAIEKGENGSVWVTQACEPPFEIELAKYESIIM